jgi:predicted phage terminase large subunit-like protein
MTNETFSDIPISPTTVRWPPIWQDHPEWGWDQKEYESLVEDLEWFKKCYEVVAVQGPQHWHAVLKNSKTEHLKQGAKSNLYFLCKHILGYKDLTPETHIRVCQFFVHKDSTKDIFEQDTQKRRLLLYPRAAFKSSIDIGDTVQYILNFPDIRIMIMTATRPLSVSFLDEVKNHFRKEKDRVPSLMNLLFPEFCLYEKEFGNEDEFICPARTKYWKEPTVFATSAETTTAGYHFEVFKGDDLVVKENAATDEQCSKVIKNYHLNRKMLLLGGFLDLIGTTYNPMDLHSLTLDAAPNLPQNESFKIICEPALKAKVGFESKDIKDLQEEECDLLFKEKLSFSELRQELHIDEESFQSQLMLNPRPKAFTTFDRPLLTSHTIPANQIPYNGPISQTWDFGFSKKKGRDYSTGSTAIWDDKGAMYIIDLMRERFKPTELAQAIVGMIKKWKYPAIIRIENVGGAKFLEPTIINEAAKTGDARIIDLVSKIDWFTPEQQKDAKRTRMASLHPWLVNNQLFFIAGLPYIETLYKEFELCLIAHHHDDIPDNISFHIPCAPRLRLSMQKESLKTWNPAEAAWNILFEEGSDAFGRIGGSAPTAQPLLAKFLDEENKKGQGPTDEFPSMLGAGLVG